MLVMLSLLPFCFGADGGESRMRQVILFRSLFLDRPHA